MLIPIPALQDNYIWLYQKENCPVLLVDIGELEPVLQKLQQYHLKVEAVLLTHYHHDHLGGVNAFKQIFPQVPVYGSEECANVATHIVRGNKINTEHYNIEVLKTPGHTAQHLSYFVDKHLFCGDTLFSAGCGRVFTGNYLAMYESLQKIKKLPDDTLICPAHEYTLSNLKFALAMAQHNDLKQTISVNQGIAKFLCDAGEATLPTTLFTEKAINPFLQAKNLRDFIALREKKDNF